MARWMTRWKPRVGCVSTSPVPATVGVCCMTKADNAFFSSSIFAAQGEEHLQNLDHEFHRSVVVVVHDDLEHRRRFDLRLARLDERGAVGFFSHVLLKKTWIPLGLERSLANMAKRAAFFKTLQSLGSEFSSPRPPPAPRAGAIDTPGEGRVKSALEFVSRILHRLLTSTASIRTTCATPPVSQQ